MSIPEKEKERRNRTVTLYLGKTLEEYEELLAEKGVRAIIEQVERADSINWGCLADGHEDGCPRHLHYTHHAAMKNEKIK